MRILSVANQKGGCGKTTVAVNLASALAQSELHVLLIDNDPQGHATTALGFGRSDFSLATRDLYLTSDVKVEDARLALGDTLHLVPTDVDLSTVEQQLAGQRRRTQRLADRLAASDMPYDYVLIDNPPQIGLLTFNALMASSEAIVPVDAGRFSVDAVGRFAQTLEMLRQERGHRVHMHVLLSNFDLRTRFARAILEELDRNLPGTRLEALIHPTVRLREAAAAGKPVDRVDGQSRAAIDFALLAIELQTIEPPADLSVPLDWAEALQSGRHGRDGVRFVARFPEADHVSLTGDFNDWSVEGEPMERQEDGTWAITLPVGPGCYEYKFIVDGVWKVDPANPERAKNAFGDVNSVLVVPPAGALG
jgi:chromosome partitioning protein